MAGKQKIGFIFECGREGPDVLVLRHFMSKLNPNFEMIPRTLDNKRRLIEECGQVAKLLLSECSRIVIVWDLYPAWREKGEKPCRHEDRENILASLTAHGLPSQKVTLVCIEEELESWLIADDRAIRSFIASKKAPHPVGRIPKIKNPDQTSNPKTRMTKLFNQELGQGIRYEDWKHALSIAEQIPDFNRLRRSKCFCRFALKAAGVNFFKK